METKEEKQIRIKKCIFCHSYENLISLFPLSNNLYNEYCTHKINIHNLKIGIDF